MRAYKKYPNRRLYDIEESKYVTVEDIRMVILKGESITVVDSKTEKNLSRTVLMQIISEQEGRRARTNPDEQGSGTDGSILWWRDAKYCGWVY